MAINSPSDISGLLLDYDPHAEAYQDAAGTTPADAVGDPVGNLPDLYDQDAGGAQDATQSTTASKPTIQEDANGWRRADADGSDDGMDVSPTFDLSDSTGWTIAFVGVVAASAHEPLLGFSGDGFVGWQTIDADRFYPVWYWDANNEQKIKNGGGDNHWRVGDYTTVVLSFDGSTFYCVATDSDGTRKSYSVTADASVVTETASYLLRSSARYAGSGMYRALVYDSALTSTERTDLWDYLESKYSSAPSGGSGENVTLGFGQAAATGYALQPQETPLTRQLGFGQASATGYALQPAVTVQTRQLGFAAAAAQGYALQPDITTQTRQLGFAAANATGYPLQITEGTPEGTVTLGYGVAQAQGYPLQPQQTSLTRQLGFAQATATGYPLQPQQTPAGVTLGYGQAAAVGYALQPDVATLTRQLGFAQALAQGWPLSPQQTARQLALGYGVAQAQGWPLQIDDSARGTLVRLVAGARERYDSLVGVRETYNSTAGAREVID